MFILDETQQMRDRDLHDLTGVSIDAIEHMIIASPPSICLFDGSKSKVPDDWTELYSSLKFLNPVAYFRTLMYTSVHSRGAVLPRLLRGTRDSVCLDFGCGVGTHAIAFLEEGNIVSVLDVPGPILEFACERIIQRGHVLEHTYKHDDELPSDYFDVIVCSDVLEHIKHPMLAVKAIHKALKLDGMLFMNYSRMVKATSGHFVSSIETLSEEFEPFIADHYTSVDTDLYTKRTL